MDNALLVTVVQRSQDLLDKAPRLLFRQSTSTDQVVKEFTWQGSVRRARGLRAEGLAATVHARNHPHLPPDRHSNTSKTLEEVVMTSYSRTTWG